MKNWGLAITGLYLVSLVVLSFPVILVAFWPEVSASEVLCTYGSWGYWLWILLVLCGELLLLFIPIRYAERRPKSRRPLLVPIITSGLLLGVLTFSCISSVFLAIYGDNWPESSSEAADIMVACTVFLLPWAIWAVLFYRRSLTDAPHALIRRATSWLLKGSIVELLVAISCHVVVRRRDDCCAPFGTFLGIAAGLSIMLLSFGPGIFFLFAERRRKLNPREHPTTDSTLSTEDTPPAEK